MSNSDVAASVEQTQGDVNEPLRLTNVFVAAPFFALVDAATGRLPAPEQARIESLIQHFENSGANVFNAHRREAWGAAFLEPPVYTRLDFDQIAASDVVVAIPGDPPSPGTHIELGWASALGKPIVLILRSSASYAGMLYGLSSVVPAVVLETNDGPLDFDALDRAVTRVVRAGAKS